MKGWHYVLGVAVIVAILAVWKRNDIIDLASGIVGKRPEELAKEDGVTVEVESLARTMQSEESGTAPRIAIGWAVKNYARKAGKSITQVVTASKNAKANGKYSKQELGKYCASFKSPSRDTLNLAQQIVDGSISDPTKGATQWDAPKAQAALHAKNPSKYKTPEAVAAARQAAGKRLVMVDGVPNTRFWA